MENEATWRTAKEADYMPHIKLIMFYVSTGCQATENNSR